MLQKVALLFLAAFAPIYVSCVSAVAKVNTDFINSAKTVGASRTQVFFHVILPSCLPDILTSLRTALSVAYTTLVSAEMVAAMTGIGWLVLDASNYLRSDIVFVGIIIMGITGLFFWIKSSSSYKINLSLGQENNRRLYEKKPHVL